MMTKLTFAALCAVLMGSAMAQDAAVPAGEAVAPAARTEPAASAVPATSSVPAATAQPPAAAETPAPQANVPVSKSSIPLEKRKGGDITTCLEAGSKSDKDVAACAEKYRP